jgi:hypothetical protein
MRSALAVGTMFLVRWHGNGKKPGRDDWKEIARRWALAVRAPVTTSWRHERIVEVASALAICRKLDCAAVVSRPRHCLFLTGALLWV